MTASIPTNITKSPYSTSQYLLIFPEFNFEHLANLIAPSLLEMIEKFPSPLSQEREIYMTNQDVLF